MNYVITVIAHGPDSLDERDHLLPTGTVGLLTATLADAGLVVDDLVAEAVEDEWSPGDPRRD
jgi:hypothetical protein